MSIVHNTKQFIDTIIDAAESNPNDKLDLASSFGNPGCMSVERS